MSGVIQPISVEKEYEKNPDISPDDINKLREWLKTQLHLPEKHISDLDLILAYFCCDKSFSVSKQLLNLHFTARTQFTNLLKYREVNKAIIDILNVALYAPLPTLTDNGYKVIYCRMLDADPKRFIFNDIGRSLLMMADLLQYEEGTWPGIVAIIDMDLVTLAHIGRLDIATLKEGIYFFQECILMKLKQIHFLNASSWIERVMMLIRPFTKKALMDLFIIHEKGSDSFYNYVSKESLPKESGGKYKDYKTIKDETLSRFENNRGYFEKENLRRVNESLRPNGKKIPEDLLEMQGSFKKLDID